MRCITAAAPPQPGAVKLDRSAALMCFVRALAVLWASWHATHAARGRGGCGRTPILYRAHALMSGARPLALQASMAALHSQPGLCSQRPRHQRHACSTGMQRPSIPCHAPEVSALPDHTARCGSGAHAQRRGPASGFRACRWCPCNRCKLAPRRCPDTANACTQRV